MREHQRVENGRLSSRIFGAPATRKLQRFLLPNLRWNQEIYGGILSQYVHSGTRWLDAGCGRHLLGVGLESSERELKSRARLMVGVDLQFGKEAGESELPLKACADLECLPFADGLFHLVSCNMVVEHLKTPAATFREFTRVLAPGGFLVIHTPNVLGYAVGAGLLVKAVLPRRLTLKLIRWAESREPDEVFPAFYRANTIRRLRALLCQAGLTERSSRYLLSPQPIFRRFAPIGFFELLLQRASLMAPLSFLCGIILVVYQKPAGKHDQIASIPSKNLSEIAVPEASR